jgi:hypothetical protein
MYARLLALETAELDKGAQAHWTRIMEIRHLKDRMVRKCQRLALPNQHAQAADATFRTVTAPPDFRLKEMERYLKGQDPKPRKSHGSSHAPRAQSPDTPPLPRVFSPSSLSPASPAGHHHQLPPRSPSPYDHTLAYVPAADFAPIYAPPPLDDGGHGGDGDDGGEYDDFRDEPLVMARSPEPLPVPYRGSRALSPLHEHPGEAGGFGSAFADLGPPPEDTRAPSPLPLTEPPEPAPGMPEPELGELPPDQRPVPRRRSSLKRRDSGSRLSAQGSARGISWALDLPRAELVRRDVELAANELNELREAYRAQLAAIRDERESIANALQQLHLKEDALRQREDELHHTHINLEGKELHYRNKGLASRCCSGCMPSPPFFFYPSSCCP